MNSKGKKKKELIKTGSGHSCENVNIIESGSW